MAPALGEAWHSRSSRIAFPSNALIAAGSIPASPTTTPHTTKGLPLARHLIADCDAFSVRRFNHGTRKERHDAWLAERMQGVGGSDMAAILGVSHFKTPYELWLEKTGREHPQDISGKWAVIKGNALEKELRNRFRALHSEWECYDGTDKSLVSNAHPCMHASLDGILYDKDRGFGVLEIKTASARRSADWHDADGNLIIPDYYATQVTHYLAVTGWAWGVVYADIGESEPVEIMFERDDEDVQAVIDAAEAFWGYVQRDEPPALTAGEIDQVQTEEMPDGFEQLEDDEFDRLAGLYKTFDLAEKDAKKQKAGIADQLKRLIGTNRQGIISTSAQVGYKTVHYKAQPEKVTPAKDAYDQRRFFVESL